MKTRTVTVREGELLGSVDWDYDFLQHYRNHGCSNERKVELCERAKALLRQIEANPGPWDACVSGYWHHLYDVGMYDGWPFWRPVPSFCTDTVLSGTEWHSFYDLDDVRPCECHKRKARGLV